MQAQRKEKFATCGPLMGNLLPKRGLPLQPLKGAKSSSKANNLFFNVLNHLIVKLFVYFCVADFDGFPKFELGKP
jgi:hypothetical protein